MTKKNAGLEPGKIAQVSGQYKSSACGEVTILKVKDYHSEPKKGTTDTLVDKTKSRK